MRARCILATFLVAMGAQSACRAGEGEGAFENDARLLFELDGPGHAFGGPGISMYPEEAIRHERELLALGITHVRFEAGPSWAYVAPPLEAAASPAEIADFVRTNFDHDAPRSRTMRETARVLRRHGIKSILVNYHIPFAWLSHDASRTLKEKNLGSLVDLWLALLACLKEQADFVPDYIEIANEPDGSWNGHIPAGLYYRIVRLLRTRLDATGMRRVQILGPGVSNLAKRDLASQWVRAADAEAVAALGGWSFHAWDEIYAPGAGPEFVDATWSTLRGELRSRRRMPVFLTEYATQSTHFGGKEFHGNGTSALYTAVETEAYALRTLVNAMIHINNGVSVPVLWTLADRDDGQGHWGVISSPATGGYYRPVYKLFAKIASWLPADSRVVAVRNGQSYGATAALMIRKAGRLYLLLANHGRLAVRREIRLGGVRTFAIQRAEILVDSASGETRTIDLARSPEDGVILELPGESVMMIQIGRLTR